MTYTINTREIPSLIGARETPSIWEIWHQKKGTFPYPKKSSKTYWNTLFFPKIIEGLEDRFKCQLENNNDQYIKVGNEIPIITRGLVEVKSHGTLPIEKDIKFIKIMQISAEQWNFSWKSSAGPNIPPDVCAELQPIMHHLNANRIAILAFIDNGNNEMFIPLSFNDELWKAEIEAISHFVGSLLNDEEPMPDYKSDHSLIDKLFSPIPKKTIKINDTAFNKKIDKYNSISERLKLANSATNKLEKEQKEIKSEIIKTMKDANTLEIPGFNIERSVVEVKESFRESYTFSRIKITENKKPS